MCITIKLAKVKEEGIGGEVGIENFIMDSKIEEEKITIRDVTTPAGVKRAISRSKG